MKLRETDQDRVGMADKITESLGMQVSGEARKERLKQHGGQQRSNDPHWPNTSKLLI
jgi:hypothetical protein